MIGGFSRPKKDKGLKVSSGEDVKTGQILVRCMPNYKAGVNVKGQGTLFATCSGKVYFSRRKTGKRDFRTFVNVVPNGK